MNGMLPSGSLPLALLCLAVGLGIVLLAQVDSRRSPRIGVQSLRAACSGLLLVSLAVVQFGLMLLDANGWMAVGVMLLLASIPASLIMAFGALTTMPERHLRLPQVGPWDDDARID